MGKITKPQNVIAQNLLARPKPWTLICANISWFTVLMYTEYMAEYLAVLELKHNGFCSVKMTLCYGNVRASNITCLIFEVTLLSRSIWNLAHAFVALKCRCLLILAKIQIQNGHLAAIFVLCVSSLDSNFGFHSFYSGGKNHVLQFPFESRCDQMKYGHFMRSCDP